MRFAGACQCAVAISRELLFAKDPYPPTSKALRGYATRRRIRFSSYRIIYEVVADQLIIHVLDAGNRKDVYKKYDRE